MPGLIGANVPKSLANAQQSAEAGMAQSFCLEQRVWSDRMPAVAGAHSPGALTKCLVRYPFPRGRCCAVFDSPPAFFAMASLANERRVADSRGHGAEYFDLGVRLAFSPATRSGQITGEGQSCRTIDVLYPRRSPGVRCWRLSPAATRCPNRRCLAVVRAPLRALLWAAVSLPARPSGLRATLSLVRPNWQTATDVCRSCARSGDNRKTRSANHRCGTAPVVFSCSGP